MILGLGRGRGNPPNPGNAPVDILVENISETNENVTLTEPLASAGAQVAVNFKCPDKEGRKFHPGVTVQLYAKDNGTTPEELDDSTPVKITYKIGVTERTLFEGVYSDVKNITETDPAKIQKLQNAGDITASQHLYIYLTPTSLATGATKIDKTTLLLKLKGVIRTIYA